LRKAGKLLCPRAILPAIAIFLFCGAKAKIARRGREIFSSEKIFVTTKIKRQRTAYGLWITPDRNRPIMSKSYPHYSQVIYTAIKSSKRTLSITLKDIKQPVH